MTDNQSYEDEDSDLMLEIVDWANINGLSSDQMEEALEAALLDESFEIGERLRDLRDFFHTKIYKEDVAANRLQRLIRSVVTTKDIMKRVERVARPLDALTERAEVICPETIDFSKRTPAVCAIVKQIADILCKTYGVDAFLRLTSNDIQIFTVELQSENEQGIECTYRFDTKENSSVGHCCMNVEALLVF